MTSCSNVRVSALPLISLASANSSAVSWTMDWKLLAFVVVLIVAALGDNAESKSFRKRDRASRRKSDNNSSFDYFLMVQQWPGSYCDTKKGCCFPVTGEPGPFFGIHGLWPNRNDGTYPTYCHSNEPFNSSELSEVLHQLDRSWGTLACTSTRSNSDFWRHEWAKHGTCSGLTQRRYFEASVALATRYDITAALGHAGIVPDDRLYGVDEVVSALRALLGHAPQVDCNKDPEGNRQLHQVYFCVGQDAATVIECPGVIRNACRGEVQFAVYGTLLSRHAVTTLPPELLATESPRSEL